MPDKGEAHLPLFDKNHFCSVFCTIDLDSVADSQDGKRLAELNNRRRRTKAERRVGTSCGLCTGLRSQGERSGETRMEEHNWDRLVNG